MEVINKTMHLSKCRDLIQKLRLAVIWKNNSNYNVDDIKYIYEKLSEGKVGYVDSRLMQWHYKRYPKAMMYMHDVESTHQKFKMAELLYKESPLCYNNSQLIRMMIFSAADITKKLALPLQDLVIISKTFSPSIFQPTIFFKNILNSNQSFKTDVFSKATYELVYEINQRVRETEIEFEHLKLSTSRKHRNY